MTEYQLFAWKGISPVCEGYYCLIAEMSTLNSSIKNALAIMIYSRDTLSQYANINAVNTMTQTSPIRPTENTLDENIKLRSSGTFKTIGIPTKSR